MNPNISLMPEATSAIQGHPGPACAAPESLQAPLYSGDLRDAMEVTGPARILPASQVFPRAGEGQTCSPGEGGQEPRPGLLFQVASGTAGWGYMHMGTGVLASPLASWQSAGSRRRRRGWMSPLGAWQGKREQGHLSPTSPLNSGASPSTQQSTGTQPHTHSPGRLGLPASGP